MVADALEILCDHQKIEALAAQVRVLGDLTDQLVFHGVEQAVDDVVLLLDGTGNTCPRGAEYAKSEATAPVRTVTSTVRALGGVRPVVAVKTVPDVPKGKIFAVMDAVRALEVKAPVHIGDILCENIEDTGSNLGAAADLDAE